MKLQKSCSILLANYALVVTADKDSLDETLDEISQEPTPKKLAPGIEMAYNKLKLLPNFLPGLDNQKQTFMKMVENYGCHCYQRTSRDHAEYSPTGGSGKPIDPLDEACRQLYRCTKCINLEDPACSVDGNNGDYNYELNDDGSSTCPTSSSSDFQNGCNSDHCSCDYAFASMVFDIWTNTDGNGWSFDDYYWHNAKNIKNKDKVGESVFDKDVTCARGFPATRPDACCGVFPDVVPYTSTERDCCASARKAYNPAVEICCSDNATVEPLGKGCV